MSFYSLVLHPSPSCSGHSFPAGGAKQYIGVYVPGESQSPFARRGSDSVFWVPLYKYEKLQQQGSTCVSGTDSVAFLMSRTRTDRQTFTRSIFSRRSTKSAIVRFKQHGGWMVVVTSLTNGYKNSCFACHLVVLSSLYSVLSHRRAIRARHFYTLCNKKKGATTYTEQSISWETTSCPVEEIARPFPEAEQLRR